MMRGRSPAPPSLSPSIDSLFVLEHADRKVLIPRPLALQDALDAAIRQFPFLSNTRRSRIRLVTTHLSGIGDHPVEISDESWPIVSRLVNTALVSVSGSSNGSNTPDTPAHEGNGSTGGAFLVKANFKGHIGLLKVAPSTRFALLRSGVFHRFGLPEDRARICWSKLSSDLGNRGSISDDLTLSEAGISEDVQIDVHLDEFDGLHPGICLLSPQPQRVDVHLDLLPCWKRVEQVLPPTVETRTPRADFGSDTEIHWLVDVKNDSTLSDVRTHYESETLYWKAPLGVKDGDDLAINDSNAVVLPVLPVKNLMSYLYDAFTSLDLPKKVQEDFMTHALSRLIGEQSHIAIRFVPQNLLWKHARLSMSPPPDYMLRVILSYKELQVSSLDQWPNAINRSKLGGEYWRDVVGVGDHVAESLADEKLFRVLEWGIAHVE